MTTELQGLMDRYWAWLKDKTTLREVDDWVEITTPHLDRHNDTLQIYAQTHGAGVLLTDGGYILDDLEMSGCGIDTPKRQAFLDMTLNGFGIRRNGNRLEVNTSFDNFPSRKHNLLQAMLAVNDLFYLAAPHVTSLFLEDVEDWLNLSDIRFTPSIKLSGKSGYDYMFNFVIPRSSAQPERVVNAINQPSRQTAVALVFAWLDTRENRRSDARAYAILNDADRRVSANVLEALEGYQVQPIRWSERESVVRELVT
jgi:hypothetical protein